MVSGRIGWATQTLSGALTLAQVESDAQWCAIPAGGVVTVLDIVLSLGFLRFLRWWLVGPGWSRWWLWWVNHLTGAVARCISSRRSPFHSTNLRARNWNIPIDGRSDAGSMRTEQRVLQLLAPPVLVCIYSAKHTVPRSCRDKWVLHGLENHRCLVLIVVGLCQC